MKGRRALFLIVLLAFVGIGGIVGMLLTGGVLNTLFFVLAALPLFFGAWSRQRHRRNAGQAATLPSSRRPTP